MRENKNLYMEVGAKKGYVFHLLMIKCWMQLLNFRTSNIQLGIMYVGHGILDAPGSHEFCFRIQFFYSITLVEFNVTY